MPAFEHRVVLADYDEDLLAPVGFEGDMLAAAGIESVTGQLRRGGLMPEALRHRRLQYGDGGRGRGNHGR